MTFRKSSAALAELIVDIGDRKTPIRYGCGIVGHDFVLEPGRITVIGAPPATGKTALASQICFEALEHHSELRLWIANAEMSIVEVLQRELSRQSSVGYQRIRDASFDDDERRLLFDAADKLLPTIKRVRHMEPPFSCHELSALMTIPEPGILLVDYLQKFRASDRDARTGVDEVVGVLRTLALEGWAILAMSATSRQQNGKKGGHDHAGLSLSSFKESGEIEFQCDAAYILRNVSEGEPRRVKDVDLDCVKNRCGAMEKRQLRFCGDFMRFEARAPERFSEFDEYGGDF